MKLYINSSRGYQATEGMSQDMVTSLLVELGATNIQFITQDEYESYLASLVI